MFLTHPRKHGAENLSLVSNVLLLFYLQLLVHKFHISKYSKKSFFLSQQGLEYWETNNGGRN